MEVAAAAPWRVLAWTPVRVTVDEIEQIVTRLEEMGESANDDSDAEHLGTGQVVWGAQVDGGPIGLAWDWCEVTKDVITMANPMMIISNIEIVQNKGEVLSNSERLLQLNNVIHELRWQERLSERRRAGRPHLTS
jgi:hypothetical protein